MRKGALWALAAALLLAGCGAPAEVSPDPALAETAAAVYAAITADLTFTVAVEEADGTATTLDVTADNAWNVRSREEVFSVSYEWYPADAADWKTQLAGDRGNLLTLAAPDGETVLQCCSGGDVVRWAADGAEGYALAVNPKEGEVFEEKLYGLLDMIAEDAVSDRVWAGTVDGSVTDLTAVADQLAEQIAENYRTVPDFVTWKPADIHANGTDVFDVYRGQPEQFCCSIGFRVKLDDFSGGDAGYWQAGAGIDDIDDEGYGGWGREVLVEKNPAGNWACVDWGTGGGSVILPFGRPENATLEELTDAFFLTEGISHDWLLPYYLLDRPDLDGLPALLDRRTEAEARDLCAVLAKTLRENSDFFENWTPESLAQALGPYAAYLDA